MDERERCHSVVEMKSSLHKYEVLGDFRCQATIADHVRDLSMSHFFVLTWEVAPEDVLISMFERDLEL